MKLHQRIRRERGKHADDWLITYADTITLLLCLFVLILSIKTGGHSLALGQTAPARSARGPEEIAGKSADFQIPTCSPDALDETVRDDTIGVVPDSGAAARVEADTIVPPIQEGGPATQVTEALPPIVQQGDRITTLRIASAAFFGSGDATLSTAGQSILRDVSIKVRSSEFAAYHITIEGHTDDTPIRTPRFQSNWELSTARAASVVRFLLEQGVAAERLTAAGYADTFPIAPNRNGDGTVNSENQARNRRVLIKLEKIDVAER